MNELDGPSLRPREVFSTWLPAQQVAGRHAAFPMPSIAALRCRVFLSPARARRIADWYVGPHSGGPREIHAAYDALADEVAVLNRAVTEAPADGGLGVRVTLSQAPEDPYGTAVDLCRELREQRTMRLRAASADPPHPVLDNIALDQVRTVHDVLGHAALGVGFDLQSEYAVWLYCCPLFSRAARPAAFCELAGAVTSYVLTGVKPVLRADLPPASLLRTPQFASARLGRWRGIPPHSSASLAA